MLQPTRLLFIAAAGIVTTAVAVLFMTETIPAPGVLYPVVAVTLLAGAAGLGSAWRAPSTATHRSGVLRSVAVFATGMTLATIVFAVYTHFASLEVEDPRHRVVWPMFAVLFIGTIVIGVAAFSAATLLTSAIVHHRRSRRRHLRTDA